MCMLCSTTMIKLWCRVTPWQWSSAAISHGTLVAQPCDAAHQLMYVVIMLDAAQHSMAQVVTDSPSGLRLCQTSSCASSVIEMSTICTLAEPGRRAMREQPTKVSMRCLAYTIAIVSVIVSAQRRASKQNNHNCMWCCASTQCDAGSKTDVQVPLA